MHLEDVLKEFIYECEIKNYSKRTIKGYRNNSRLFHTFLIREFNIVELEKVQAVHIKQYISFLQNKKLTESHINGIIKNFRAFFKYCMKEEYIEKNPILKVDWMREPKVLIKTFTDKEICGLLNAYSTKDYLNIRNKAIVAILIDTVIRIATIENIDVKQNHIKILGKGNKERNEYFTF